jgi:large subunit ribosomal protein L17
LRQS